MESLKGYHEIARQKTYIDKYPGNIIDVDQILTGGFLFEFGPGNGNDIRWLFEQGKPATEMASVEAGYEAMLLVRANLDEILTGWGIMHLPGNILNMGYEGLQVQYVYANNILHCLGSEDNMYQAISQAHRLLAPGGVFFGRTLSDQIDYSRMDGVKARLVVAKEKREQEKPQDATCIETVTYETDLSTGQTVIKRAIYDNTTPEGVARLALYNWDKEYKWRYGNHPITKEEFVLRTVVALEEGKLIGISPQRLKQMAREAGFDKGVTRVKRHPWRPTADFYFRFEKLK